MLKFDESLARSRPPIPEDMRPGPCAMGPADGDELTSMHVWIFQQTATGLAVASGDSRQPQAQHLRDSDRWMVITGLDPQSKPFDTEKPAVAMAMALVTNADGQDVKQWSQAVYVTDEEAETRYYGGR
jgi:hypothetical protein